MLQGSRSTASADYRGEDGGAGALPWGVGPLLHRCSVLILVSGWECGSDWWSGWDVTLRCLATRGNTAGVIDSGAHAALADHAAPRARAGGGLDSGDTAGGHCWGTLFVGGPFSGGHIVRTLSQGSRARTPTVGPGRVGDTPLSPPSHPPRGPGVDSSANRPTADGGIMQLLYHASRPLPEPAIDVLSPPRMVSTSKIRAAGAPTPRMGRIW